MRLHQLLMPSLPSILLVPLLSLQIHAADSQLPALSDTSGANKPAALSTSTPKKAASKTAAAASQTSKAANTKATTAAAKSSGPSGSTLPALTSSGTDLGGLVTGLPKLAGDDYPAPTVPPTAGAPFMQKSHLPEGTVFICVGAVLAFIGLVILAWRGIVAWSLHRSVRKSAMGQSSKYTYIGTMTDSKGLGGGVSNLGSKLASPFAGSTLTLDQLRPSSKLGGGGGGSSKLSAPGSRNSLFFSPTAGGGAGGNLMSPGTSNRGSAYLPAGYYASGQSQPGTANNHNRNSISLSNLAPPPSAGGNHGHNNKRSSRVSPPRSPSRPSTGRQSLLGTNLNLNLSTTALAGGHAASNTSESRAPSAFLEELFESASAAPPAAAPPPAP
ncbi:MAG: hypothetical protein Q9191_008209, partial [Dirinaria sp. TL-2023a]